jgi:hypothetical protein
LCRETLERRRAPLSKHEIGSANASGAISAPLAFRF